MLTDISSDTGRIGSVSTIYRWNYFNKGKSVVVGFFLISFGKGM